MSDRANDANGRLRAANLRTALVLASVALTFFFGVIAAKFLGGFGVGMSILAFAAALFIAVAVALNLGRGGATPTGEDRKR